VLSVYVSDRATSWVIWDMWFAKLQRKELFLLSKISTLILGTTRFPIQWVQGSFARGEANETRSMSRPYSAQAKNEWSSTSSLPYGQSCPRYDKKTGTALPFAESVRTMCFLKEQHLHYILQRTVF